MVNGNFLNFESETIFTKPRTALSSGASAVLTFMFVIPSNNLSKL